MKVRSLIPVLAVFLLELSFCQDWEILPLSKKVGTVLDAEENLFYSVYPDIKGFVSAQFYQVDNNTVNARIVYFNRGVNKTSNRRMSLRTFVILQNKVNGMKQITQKDRDDLKKDLVYLETNKILSSIPINRYVVVSRVQGRKLRGNLLAYDGNDMLIKTKFGRQHVSVTNLKKISIRKDVQSRPRLKWTVPGVLAAGGFSIAGFLVSNENKGTDRETYARFTGAALALTATKPVIDQIQAYLTPMESFDLSPEKIKKR